MGILRDYEIISILKENVKIVIYKAIDRRTQKSVIIKALKEEYPELKDIERLKHEYQIVKKIDSSNVVKPIGIEKYQNGLALILEYFDGISIKYFLAENRIEIKDFLKIAIKIASGLEDIHKNSLVHGDIKPSNLIINPKTLEVKIIDFGISSLLKTVENNNLLEGTLAYMSPEQTGRMNRSIDYRSDLYSLGITLYEMLTGILPYESEDDLELVHCHIAKTPVSPQQIKPEIPAIISNIIMKLLAKTAEERYQSAIGLKIDLETCLDRLENEGEISYFEIGDRDLSAQLNISQKLYGREKEVASLMAAFERVCQGNKETILVAGYSGIGKSSIVNEVRKRIDRENGFFISGKCEQFQRDIPYSCLIQAFRELIVNILSESKEKIEEWRSKFLAAFGINGQVIIDVIPEVELIIGKQPAIAKLGLNEAKNLFNLVFQEFVLVFARSNRPLVLFLDDLQWIDTASLELIYLLMTNRDLQYLLLVGAYRDNEVSPSHPLMLSLDRIVEKGNVVNIIFVGNLSLNKIAQSIADTFNTSPDKVESLARLCHKKTNGNPFFSNQLLKSLYAGGLIYFDFNRGIWKWNIEEIESIGISDNVVDLMVNKIQKLKKETQNLLKIAACIGNRFDLEICSLVNEKTRSQTIVELWEALEEGLIVPLNYNYEIPLVRSPQSLLSLEESFKIEYKFLHDRVQQAAYTLVSEVERKKLHLKIGRLLKNNLSEKELEKNIFDLVNHLNEGAEFIEYYREIYQLSQLNLKASIKARHSNAYQAALKYSILGLNVLPKDSWVKYYDLTFALYRQRAKCEYLCGNYETADRVFEIILKEAKSKLEIAEIQSIRLTLYDSTSKYLENLRVGSQTLKLFDVNLPIENKTAILSEFQKELQVYRSNLDRIEIIDLINAPEMSDRRIKACLKILTNMTGPAYFTNQELLALIALKIVNFSIEYGNLDISAQGYCYWGIVAVSSLSEYKAAYQFGQLALKLVNKYQNASLACKVFNLFGGHISHWKTHVKESIPIHRKGYQAGVENGDLVYSCYNSYHLILQRIRSGDNLNEIVREANKCLDWLQKNKNPVFAGLMEIYRHFIFNWQDLTNERFSLRYLEFKELECLQMLKDNLFHPGLATYNIFKTQIYYLYEDYNRALEMAKETQNTIIFVSGIIEQPEHYLYYSLILTALYPNATKAEREEYKQILKLHLEKFQTWSDNCPENYLHKYLLVAAEIARISGKTETAMDLYDRAIESAKENDFINNEALANELAAKFWLSKGKTKIAKIYFQDAVYAYQRWGATRKVKDLQERYSEFISINNTSVVTNTKNSYSSPVDLLDLNTVFKASQAISSEIKLEILLVKLIKIALENVGAQWGCLLLEKDGQLYIEAQGRIDEDRVHISQSIVSSDRLPTSIVNYVARTRETVLENNAADRSKFSEDVYIKTNQTKSIVCAPLIDRGELSGIIYLENNLTTHAFTKDRVKVLQLLFARAAIAITNAKLYTELEESNTRLMQFLEAMPVGVSVYDASGQLQYVNQLAKRLLAMAEDDRTHTADFSRVYRVYRAKTDLLYPTEELPLIRALKGETAKAEDLEIRRKNRVIPLEVSSTPIFDENNQIEYAIASFIDISDRKQTEKLLADYNHTLESQVKHRTREFSLAIKDLQNTQEQLIESEKMAALGNLVAGVAHEINTPMGAIQASIGNISHALNNSLNLLPQLFAVLSPEEREDFFALIKISKGSNKSFSFREERKFKRAIASQLADRGIENKDSFAATLVHLGITENIDPFLSLLCHPQNQLILETAYNVSIQHQDSENVKLALERVSKIVFALKNYARKDDYAVKTKANITEGIDIVLTIYSDRLKRGIKVNKDYQTVPEILCYPEALNQVWTNLIYNAIHAMKNEGNLDIVVALEKEQIVVAITDSGCGIPPDIQQKIFTPFFTTKPRGEGSGMGLHIVSQIIDRHQGKITVNSQPGNTTFKVYLPVV